MVDTRINMQPPFDLWYKIFGLISFLAELADADLKTIGGKEIQDKFQVARAVLDDSSIKAWVEDVKELKRQNVLKQ